MSSKKKKEKITSFDDLPPVPQQVGETPENPAIIQSDGTQDMFHQAHAKQLQQCVNFFKQSKLYVGVSGDEETLNYKGKTIMNEQERAESLRHCKYVDKVQCPCEWIISPQFLYENGIHYVAHDSAPYDTGASGETTDIQSGIKKAGRFLATQRTAGISTSDVVFRIIKDQDKYVIRNIGRGYTRNELNISWTRLQRIMFNEKKDNLKNKIVNKIAIMKNKIVSKKDKLKRNLSNAKDKKSEEIKNTIESQKQRWLGYLNSFNKNIKNSKKRMKEFFIRMLESDDESENEDNYNDNINVINESNKINKRKRSCDNATSKSQHNKKTIIQNQKNIKK